MKLACSILYKLIGQYGFSMYLHQNGDLSFLQKKSVIFSNELRRLNGTLTRYNAPQVDF